MRVLLAKLEQPLDVPPTAGRDASDNPELVELDTHCNGLILQAYVSDFFRRSAATGKADKDFLWVSPAFGRFDHVFVSMAGRGFPLKRLKVCLAGGGVADAAEYFYTGAFDEGELASLRAELPSLKPIPTTPGAPH